jgi:hypothetical protein
MPKVKRHYTLALCMNPSVNKEYLKAVELGIDGK